MIWIVCSICRSCLSQWPGAAWWRASRGKTPSSKSCQTKPSFMEGLSALRKDWALCSTWEGLSAPRCEDWALLLVKTFLSASHTKDWTLDPEQYLILSPPMRNGGAWGKYYQWCELYAQMLNNEQRRRMIIWKLLSSPSTPQREGVLHRILCVIYLYFSPPPP